MNANTYSLLSQLSSPLVLAIPQQFDDTTFIGCETGDFFDNVTDELGAFGEVAFGAGGAGFALESGCFLRGDGMLARNAGRNVRGFLGRKRKEME